MVLNKKIAEAVQQLAGERIVTLYQLDATLLGGEVYYFCNTFDRFINTSSIVQSGNTVTVTTVDNHALVSGDFVEMYDCNLDSVVSGNYQINVTGAKTFTFNVGGSPFSATAESGTIYRSENSVIFDNQVYTPIPVEAEGFEKNGQGSLPTPTFRVSNATKALMPGIIAFEDLTGSTFKRIRTMRKFLDDGSDPDTEAVMPYDVYTVNRKLSQNRFVIEYELASPFDQENVKLPRRSCLKNACTHTYRIYNSDTGAFDYSNASCPYSGSLYFNDQDVAEGLPQNDRCGKRLSSCKLRFGSDPLPTRAFPGLRQR